MARQFYSENNEAIPAIKYEATPPIGFTEIIDSVVLHRLYLLKYAKAEIDGSAYYNKFRADLYLEIINGTRTAAEGFALESHLVELKAEIIGGNWLTAQNISQNLTLSGVYDQALKDEIQAEIDQYVTDNY